MRFFAKLRDLFIRIFSKIKCNCKSSCFNVDRHVEHNEHIIYIQKKEDLIKQNIR